jgi:CYTH domain
MDQGLIDHQVTYSADFALQAGIRQRLGHHRSVHRVLRSTYFDSPEEDLYRRGITLRERSTIGAKAKAKVEAKIPSSGGLKRFSGSTAHAAIADAVGSIVVERLQPVAIQMRTRELLLCAGSFFAPQFVVALDVADVEFNGRHQQRFEIEAQIFTALPWTKRVSERRVDRFRQFCWQLELDFNLRRAAESEYEAIVVNAASTDETELVPSPR